MQNILQKFTVFQAFSQLRRGVGSVLLLVCLLVVSACDSGDLETLEAKQFINVRNANTGKVSLQVQELHREQDNQSAQLILDYELTGIDTSSLPAGARLFITVVDSQGVALVVADPIPLTAETAAGEVVVLVPASSGDDVSAVATVEIESADQNEPPLQQTHAVLDIDLSNEVEPSDLSLIQDFSVELVPDTYESSVQGQRRIHRFAVRAYDQDCVSLRGLGADVGEYFQMHEDSFIDVESPVTYDSRNSFIHVYFVLDASSSISSNDRAQLINATRYASDRMRDDYVVDFRQFSGDIKKLSSYHDYQPDTGQSATAFYYAIDSVLQEIEQRGRNDDHHVIIGFTDGVDLASRNHYGEDYSHDAVRALVRDKVSQFRNAPEFVYGSGLELHVLSVGDVEAEKPDLDALANAGGGEHVFASDKAVLEPLLESLVDRILATYHLQYSSQQTAADTDLLIQVTIGSISKPLRIQYAGGNRPVQQQHFCRSR